jgi:hypothetical protein
MRNALTRKYAVGSAPHLDPLPAPSGERRARTHLSRIPVRLPGHGATEGPLSLRKRERVRVRVRLDCMDTAKSAYGLCSRSWPISRFTILQQATGLASHSHPPIAGVVRFNGKSCVGLLHSRHVVCRKFVKLEDGLQLFGHPRFVVFRDSLVRTRIHRPDAI